MRRLSRLLVVVSAPALSLSILPAAWANPPIELFGSMFNQMIQLDQQNQQRRAYEQQQHEVEQRQRAAQMVLVKRLQVALTQLGYYSGRIDGDFGSGTQAALAAYQRDRNQVLRSDLSEYDVVDIETAARSQQNQPAQQAPAPQAAEAPQAPAPEYTPVTPESAWDNYRFSQVNLGQPGPYRPAGDAGWLVVASATEFQDVVGAAISYAQDFPSTAVIKSNNGRYAIVIGWLPKDDGDRLLLQLKQSGILPRDAFVSSGQRYVGPVWTSSAASSRNDLLRLTFLRASPQLWDRVLKGGNAFSDFRSRVAGVNGQGDEEAYLSLRKAAGAGEEEIARMPEGTLLALRESNGAWSRVGLLDGREGWASSKYIALNDDALQGRSAPAPQPEKVDPYGDKDLQDRLMQAGNETMQDIGLFLKSNPDVPGMTAIAEQVSALNAALGKRDYQMVESATVTLRQMLTQNEAYRLFQQQQDDKRKAEEKRLLGEAVSLANRNVYFLKAYIPANVTAPVIGELTGFLKEFTAALASPTRASLDDVNGRFASAVSRNNLDASYQDGVKGYVAPREAAAEQSQPAPEDQQQLKKLADGAQALLEQVSRYGATGKRVADPIQAARLIVNLKNSLRAADAVAITRDQKALEALLSGDKGFTTFRDEENSTRQAQDQQKLEDARREAARLVAFINDYAGRNFVSDKLEVLLAAQDKLNASLKGGNGPDLFDTVATATQMIDKAGLKADLDSFRFAAPDQQQLAQELDIARQKATNLLDEVAAFSADKRTLSEPLTVARLVSALRGTIGESDGARIAAATEALQGKLQQDAGFRDYLQQQAKSRGGLDSAVAAEQNAEAQRIRGFIVDYVAHNVAQAGLGSLLDADAALASAMTSGDVAALTKANDSARQAIAGLGAADALKAFTLAAPLAEGRTAAMAVLGVLDAYAKSGKSLAEPLKVAQLVTGLRQSLEGQDEAAVSASEGALELALKADAGFAAFRESYDKAQQRQAQDQIAGLKDEAKRIRAFIEQQVSRNVSSPDVPQLLALAQALEDATTAGDQQKLSSATAAADESLAALKLGDALRAFTLAPQAAQPAVESSSNEIAIDDKNRELLTGGSDDVLVLFNTSGSVKGVRRDLLGRIVFGDTVSLCWYQEEPKPDDGIRMTFAEIRRMGARGMTVSGVCKADGLPAAELVMLRRGAFLATDRAYAKALVDGFAAGQFQLAAIVKGDDVRLREAADQRSATDIRSDVLAGRRQGYGVLRFAGDGGSLCYVPGPYDEALASKLAGAMEPLSGALPGLKPEAVASADAVFAAAKNGHCRAAVLSADAMALVITGGERDKLAFDVMPVWFEVKDLESEQKRLDAERATRAQAEAARQQQLADAAKEEEKRREKLGLVKAEQEAAMRRQYESVAQGLAADIGDQLRSFLDAPDKSGSAEIDKVFPAFADWYHAQVNGGWELQSDGYITSLADYGTAHWEDRMLDTVFVTVTVGMNHRDLGKYKSQCFLLGVIVDKEFRRYRDVFEQPCQDAEPSLGNWSEAKAFESRWIVK